MAAAAANQQRITDPRAKVGAGVGETRARGCVCVLSARRHTHTHARTDGGRTAGAATTRKSRAMASAKPQGESPQVDLSNS